MRALTKNEIEQTSQYFSKKDWGLHNVFLNGNDFQRGQQFGLWTQNLLLEQEKSLLKKLEEIFPLKITQYSIALFSMVWFQGLESYLKPQWMDEMYGVSLFAPEKRLFFASAFTRQVAYHGIHDMGQMMIDRGLVLGACSQIAIPDEKGWLIGRNFDFEAGRVFDEDKVIKWVFPTTGIPFVSVIFSGMVGVITGINQNGVYVAINAAGSEDFTRLGTPTTLIALNAIQNSKNAKEAVEIIKKSKSLITEIFVVTDTNSPLYIVEKTPNKTRVLKRETKSGITNHLQHPDFQMDPTNIKRMRENTTVERLQTIERLLPEINNQTSMANALRSKLTINEQVVLGHRSSVDAMIASHSVIYNSHQQTLHISQGPSLIGPYIGYDLRRSFIEKKPILIEKISSDSLFKENSFYKIKNQIKAMQLVRELATRDQCEAARSQFEKIDPIIFNNHYSYFWSKALLSKCFNESKKAIIYFKKALSLNPAYKREKDQINEQIKQIVQ